jgi:endonuclease YncB( thermonuclease family)
MPAARKIDGARSILLCGCALAALGWIAVGSAQAQPAAPGTAATPTPPAAAVSQPGGLDMDVNPTAPATAARQSEPGDLDMDVNPTAPAPAPAPVVASRPAIQAMSRDNVTDGVHIAPMNPGPLETAAGTGGQPGTQPTTTMATTAPPAATTTAVPPPATTTAAPAPSAFTTVATPAPPATAAAAPAPSTAATTTVAAPASLTGAPSTGTPSTGALPAAEPEPVNIDHPTVVDTADLKTGDTTVSLFGIDGVQGEAAQGLQGFLASGESHLTCQAQATAGFVCLLPDGTDVAEVALVNGAARAKDDAPNAYRDQEAAAQAARRGIWANLPPPPATVKHPVVQDTATLVADGQTYVLNGVVGLGAPFAGQLQGYIAANGDSLTCQPQIEPGQYICMMDNGADIAKVALVNGAARVGPDAPDSYRAQQLDALNNHRGFWLNPPSDVLLAVTNVEAVPVCCAYDPGDDGADGITYVGGVPEAIIDGEPEFLYYGGDAGWGYYDHFHHWRGAPDRFRHHLEHFHPDGHGLRGYGHDAELRRDAVAHHEEAMRRDGGVRRDDPMRRGDAMRRDDPMRRDDAMRRDEGVRHEAALRQGVGRPGGVGEHPGMGGAARPGMGGMARPGMAGRPGGFGGPGAHPGGMGGGFMRPSPSMGGFHPGGGSVGRSAPVMHASSGGGGGKRK